MAESIQPGDFIQLEYTGSIVDSGAVFDTTNEAVAKKHELHGRNAKYGPVIICIGEHQLIKGIDEALIGKSVDAVHVFDFPPEHAFGKKNAKMIQLIPTQKFLKEGIRPMPGLQITVDNTLGLVKSVSGGRTLVDFNHPLAGKVVHYEVKVLSKITDAAAKLKAFVERTLQLPDASVTVAAGKAVVQLPFPMPEELRGEYIKKVQQRIPEITALEFTVSAPADSAVK